MTMIRIHNASAHDYQELQVGDQAFGDLAPGAKTEYRPFPGAYRYTYVRLLINGEELVLQPIDYVGEELLGEGHFTYSISVGDLAKGLLIIEARSDFNG